MHFYSVPTYSDFTKTIIIIDVLIIVSHSDLIKLQFILMLFIYIYAMGS